MAKLTDDELAASGLPRDVETFLSTGTFQVRLPNKDAIIKAWAGSCGHHQAQAAPAASSTKIRKGLASRSASCAMGGLLTAACCISATTWA